jgi:hypothetical protein
MKTDTTLFDLYSELNVLPIMQNEEVVEFIEEVCAYAEECAA